MVKMVPMFSKELALFLIALLFCGLEFASCKDQDHVDPFDMINFDHATMKMKKPSKEVKSSAGTSTPAPPAEERSSEPEEPPEKGAAKDPPVSRPEKAVLAEGQCLKAAPQLQCPALSLFQQFVARLLRFLRPKVAKLDEDTPTELCLHLSLSYRQLRTLERFRDDHGKDRVFSAHEELSQAIKGAHSLDSIDPELSRMWFEETIGMTLDKAVQMLCFMVLTVTLAWLLPKLHLSYKLLYWLFFVAFLVSVAFTWLRMYKSEVAKQQSTLMKDPPEGCRRLPAGGNTLVNLYKYYFTFEQDACIEYYEHLYIDPIVKVSPMEALAVAIVQTALKPLRIVGTEVSEFLRALMKDLPVQWQMVALVFVPVVLGLVLLLYCGYSFRVPFLLAIEPTRHPHQHQVRALEQRIAELQAAVENNRPASVETSANHPALENDRRPSIGAAPLNDPPFSAVPPAGPSSNINRSARLADETNRPEPALNNDLPAVENIGPSNLLTDSISVDSSHHSSAMSQPTCVFGSSNVSQDSSSDRPSESGQQPHASNQATLTPQDADSQPNTHQPPFTAETTGTTSAGTTLPLPQSFVLPSGDGTDIIPHTATPSTPVPIQEASPDREGIASPESVGHLLQESNESYGFSVQETSPVVSRDSLCFSANNVHESQS